MAPSPGHAGLLGLLLLAFGCSEGGGVFVDLDLIPDELRFVAVLPMTEDRTLREGTGLFDRALVSFSEPLELDGVSELVIVAYSEGFLEPLPAPEILRQGRLQPATVEVSTLPRPSLALRARIEDGELKPTGPFDPGPLTADWVSCPPTLGDGGFVLASCLNCVGTLSRHGCRLAADLSGCGMGEFDVALGSEGSPSSLGGTEPALGECTLARATTSLSTVSCEFPERPGGCELALLPPTTPDPFEVLSLIDVPPYDDPYAGGRLPGGYLFGAARLGGELAVVTTDRSPQSWNCWTGADRTSSRVVYVDPERFQVTRTATSAGCMRWPLPDPHHEDGFLAVFSQEDEHRFGRFDRNARLQSWVPLGSILDWHVSDAVILAEGRAAVSLVEAFTEGIGRVLFIELEPEALSIELDHASDATFITALSRVSDTAVGALSDGSDNVRVIDLGMERGHYYIADGCGITNLSSAGLWMSDDEQRAVGAFRDSGTLLLMEPRTETCRFARAPVHPQTFDPIVLVPKGSELFVSFWGRTNPPTAAIGRLDLTHQHLRSAFTDLGPGIVNRLLVDGDLVYGTITDRAELVRLRPAP